MVNFIQGINNYNLSQNFQVENWIIQIFNFSNNQKKNRFKFSCFAIYSKKVYKSMISLLNFYNTIFHVVKGWNPKGLKSEKTTIFELSGLIWYCNGKKNVCHMVLNYKIAL